MDSTKGRNPSESKSREGNRPASLLVVLLLLFPVLLHVIGFTVSFIREDHFAFGKLDLLVLLCLCLYLSFSILIVRKREASRKFVLLVYSTFIPAVAVESFALLLDDTSGRGLPWPPMRQVSVAGDTMPGIDGEISFTVTELGVRAPGF